MFTETGSYISNLGKKGRLVGQLLRPIGICVTKEGCVVFTDYETKCVNVFKGMSITAHLSALMYYNLWSHAGKENGDVTYALSGFPSGKRQSSNTTMSYMS